MSLPVRLSDALVLDARVCAELTERSIAGQIEFWAGLGKAIESLLRLDDVLTLKKNGAARSLSECLQQVDSPAGRRGLEETLRRKPFPHYEPAPDRAAGGGGLIRVDADGTRTPGRFVNRRFVPAPWRHCRTFWFTTTATWRGLSASWRSIGTAS